MKSEVIQVRVDDKLLAAIKKLADQEHRTVSDYVRVKLIELTEKKKGK